MPEYPDITVYIESLATRIVDQPLLAIRLASPFLVRTAVPSLRDATGKKVRAIQRIGKRIVFELEGELYLVLHLMIAGRLRWKERGAAVPKKVGLLGLDFPGGTLLLTEASLKKRASLHVVQGAAALLPFDRGGLDVFAIDLAAFRERLAAESHTLKRALTDPRLFDGIGNAYSDEILHAARLSPVKLSTKLTAAESKRLYDACRGCLGAWTERLRKEAVTSFPEHVTAFRDGMAVHGRFGEPCPVCGDKVQRIVHADNETNYCARCQNGGKLLADRALSRLLHGDWPRTLEELEDYKAERRA